MSSEGATQEQVDELDGKDSCTLSAGNAVGTPNGRTGLPDTHTLGESEARKLYVAMVRTRILDEKLVGWQRQGRIGFHIGSLGEEACILASAFALRSQDWIFPSYREFGALLLRGMPLSAYLGNMRGNENDPAKGRQMPDHYTGRPYRVACVSSPIATQISQAVGFAWALRARGDSSVAAVYFGDGATSSGEFHAGLNLAGVFRTPNVFLLRNNGWAISTPVAKQTASSSLHTKAHAYGVRAVQCDGNDIHSTYGAVRAGGARAARGDGPTLVEMMTCRLGGHSTSDDPGLYRDSDDVRDREADPVNRLRMELEGRGQWDAERDAALRDELEAELRCGIEEAERAAAPAPESLFDDVYAELPRHLARQREQLMQELERESRAGSDGGGR